MLAGVSGREAIRDAGAVSDASLAVDLQLVSSAFSAANDAPVVRVVADSCKGREAGSGVIVGDGIVITARHVVRGATSVTVDAAGIGTFDAEVLGVDGAGRDIAVLRVPALRDARAARIATDEVGKGVSVAASGHPRGGERRTIGGPVLGYIDSGPLAADGGRVLAVGAAFEPGMSGGPVVDAGGRLVAIAIGVERNSGTGIAVPVGTIEDTLRGTGLLPPPRCDR